MSYDDADRALRINETWGGGRDTAYTYDPDGKIDSRKVDGKVLSAGGFDGGRMTRFAFDEVGREEQMTVVVADAADRVTNTSYWPSGQTRERDKARGATDRTYFDSAARLSRMVRNNQAGGEVKDQSYSYDDNANRSRDERGTHEFNARNQLVKWTRAAGRPDPGSTVSYELNASGAILNKTDTATSPQLTKYTYTENPTAGTTYIGDRLISSTQGDQTTTYDYNALGDITKIDVPTGTDTTYGYDDFERRDRTTGPGGSEAYTYDALDRRDKTTKAGNTFDHSYIGLTEQLSREQPTAGSGGATRTFDYDSALQRQGQSTSTGYRSFALDANGSVEGLESATGALASADTYVYDPYGALEGQALSTEAGAAPFRFQGHYSDSAVNTYDMQARSYRPDIGRFLSPDRYESASGDVALQSDPLTNNRYAFLGGNPVSNVEWDGHEPEGSFKNGCDNTYGSDARCAKESKGRQAATSGAPTYALSSNWARGRASKPKEDVAQAKRWADANLAIAAVEVPQRRGESHTKSCDFSYRCQINRLGAKVGEAAIDTTVDLGVSTYHVGRCNAQKFDQPSYCTGEQATLDALNVTFALGGPEALALAAPLKRMLAPAIARQVSRLAGSRGAAKAGDDVGLSSRGLRPAVGTRVRPPGIPDGWRVRPTKGDGGTWYYDPSNKNNAVRVMQGDPKSPFPNSQAPYVRWQRNGQPLDAAGNVLPSKFSPDAHIPLWQFKFRPDL